MTKKNKIIIFAVVGTILFAILLGVELYLVRVFDTKVGNERRTFMMRVMKSEVEDEYNSAFEEDSYSDILNRELTQEEINNRKELSITMSNILLSNIGMSLGIVLPDGNWLIDDDQLYIEIMNEERDHYIFTLDNADILNEYRKYTENSYYHYDKWKMLEKYRYYVMVLESFYVDDIRLVPEKISIYEVECNLDDTKPEDEVNALLVDTIEFNIENVAGLDYYEIVDEIDGYSVDEVRFNYACNGNEGYSAVPIVLTEKVYSVEERREILEDCLNETYEFQKRDLVGISKYYFVKEKHFSKLYNDYVTLAGCEDNIFYDTYKHLWQYVLLILVMDMIAAYGIAALIFVIKKRSIRR